MPPPTTLSNFFFLKHVQQKNIQKNTKFQKKKKSELGPTHFRVFLGFFDFFNLTKHLMLHSHMTLTVSLTYSKFYSDMALAVSLTYGTRPSRLVLYWLFQGSDVFEGQEIKNDNVLFVFYGCDV